MLSNADKTYIETHSHMTAEELKVELSRPLKEIQAYLDTVPKKKVKSRVLEQMTAIPNSAIMTPGASERADEIKKTAKKEDAPYIHRMR